MPYTSLEEFNYNKIKDIEQDLVDLRESLLSNFQLRIITCEETVHALDARTRIFVPQRTNDD